jgi:diketogulonate reductase-like aldo/keto reductase
MNITDISGTFTLSNRLSIPYFGLGVFRAREGTEINSAILKALNCGYRHVDTAAIYRNETGVGKAIKESGIARNEVFITTKLWNADQGYESTLKAFERSLNKLQTDYIDLYLIHWPVRGKYAESWRAMEELYRAGKVRAIGVSNFTIHHLKDLMKSVTVNPMVNQVEFHPYLVQPELLEFCQQNNIQYEAWSPIMRGKVNEIAVISAIARKHSKNNVQVVLRWNLQKGVVTIPKSVNKDRIQSNANIFDFELSDEDIQQIDALDRNYRTGPDPDNFDF